MLLPSSQSAEVGTNYMIFKEVCTFFDEALVLEAATIRPEPGALLGMNNPARSTSMHLGSVDSLREALLPGKLVKSLQ
jgi:hypothetical protein